MFGRKFGRKHAEPEVTEEAVMMKELGHLAHVKVEPMPVLDGIPAQITCPTCGTRVTLDGKAATN